MATVVEQFSVGSIMGEIAVIMDRMAALSLDSKKALNNNVRVCVLGAIFGISISKTIFCL